ncbi:MAG: WYL domain-containing protein [Bacteroidaceae bacterium]|nr:WYL domain-containing protein [Bacteroidaceae bacterium]
MARSFDNRLSVMLLLSQNQLFSIEQIVERTGIQPRMVYRHIEDLRRAGFIIHKTGHRYQIDPDSPFFKKLAGHIHFSKAEAASIVGVLMRTYNLTPPLRRLCQKLSELYDNNIMLPTGTDERTAHNTYALYEAIRTRRIVKLNHYYSHSSQTHSDRIVEPFQFLAGNTEVRCFEIASKTNKTFKIARAESVELLDLEWSYRSQHEEVVTDLFDFVGEPNLHISLSLGNFAATLLREEHPAAAERLTPQPDGKQMLDIMVCSYKGVGRFVLGMFDDIEVLGSEDFKNYLKEKINNMNQKI